MVRVRWQRVAAISALIVHTVPAEADPAVTVEAAAGMLLLERFDGDSSRPKAWTYGVTGIAHLQHDQPWGLGASVLLSQFDSFRAPCPPDALCSRSFHRGSVFGELRWMREVDIAWEPWLRAGPAIVSAASAPESGEGDTVPEWAFAGDFRLGSDARLRWLLLGAEGNFLVTTGSISTAWGLALHVGVRIR